VTLAWGAPLAGSGQVEVGLVGQEGVDHEGGDGHVADPAGPRRDPGAFGRYRRKIDVAYDLAVLQPVDADVYQGKWPGQA